MLMKLNEARPNYSLYFLNDDEGSSKAFLSAQPVIPFKFNKLLNSGVQYVVVSNEKLSGSNAQFYSELKRKGKVVAGFTPYRDKTRSFPVENVTRTAGPLKSREVYARERNGEIITIYSIGSNNRRL